MVATFEEARITVRDGLRLYVRHYPALGSPLRPVLCLAGLTRNSRDFQTLASALSDQANGAPRPVYALDARGRGASDHAPDWKSYTVPTEAQDVIDVMTALSLHGAAVIGTSRGGLVTMVLGALQPTLIGAVVLNDIGPVIDREGLIRIAGYVGRVPLPRSWPDAAALVRDLGQRQFPNVKPEQWEAIARQRFNEVDGRPAPGYDKNLGKTLSVLDGPLPMLWPQFKALSGVPTMVIRGARSDLLSPATIAEMAAQHPKLTALTVPDEGHAPLLEDRPTISAIHRFLARADAGHAHAA